ncbi:hypothetical protein JG688_00004683, partial [Phytophthora aleatoria]
KAVWRELREEGWTSKPPPRNALDLLYRYIRPGSSLKGQEGRGFFIGEQALLDFYLQEIVPSATKRNYSEQCSTTETNSEQQNGTVTLATDSRSMTCENVLAAGSAQNDNPDDIDYTTDRVRVTEERCAMVDDASCLNEQRNLRLLQPRICHTGQGKTDADCMMAGGNDAAIREHSRNEYQTDSGIPPLSPVPPHMPVGRSPGTCAPSLYLNAMVAFPPSRERWTKDKFYKKVGTAYIVSDPSGVDNIIANLWFYRSSNA